MTGKKIEVATLIRAGHSVSEVMKLTKVWRKTCVFNIKKCLKDGEDLKDQPRGGRPSKLKPETVKAAFKNNPKMKMTFLAKKKVLVVTISKTVKKARGSL